MHKSVRQAVYGIDPQKDMQCSQVTWQPHAKRLGHTPAPDITS